MKKYFLFLLFVINSNTFSQTNTDDLNIPINNNDINDVKDRNLEQALKVVAPISEITGNLQSTGAIPEQETVYSLTMKEANKIKLNGYSDVKVSDVYRTNEDGTRTAKGDRYNTTTGEVYNEETVNEPHYSKHSSFGGKIFKIIGLIIFWFVAGFIINFFFYSGKPDYLLGKSQTAKTLHVILNIVTAIALLANIFA